jgi:hypothetical protein
MRIPDTLKKGVILYGDSKKDPASPSTLIAYGNAYVEGGRIHDALECYYRAEHTEGIEKIVEEAVSAGDFFLYRMGMVFLGREMDKKDLNKLAENARRTGKLAFARDAYEMCGDDKAKKEIEKKLESLGTSSKGEKEGKT